MDKSITPPDEDEFDTSALNAAYEAFFEATGGNYGGMRAAIKTYNDGARRARIARLARSVGLHVEREEARVRG